MAESDAPLPIVDEEVTSTTEAFVTSEVTKPESNTNNPPSVADDGSGSASDSDDGYRAPSESSTLAHEQTPFSEFSEQVKELCHLLWPPSPKTKELRVERLLGSSNVKLLGALRSNKFGRILWPASAPKEFVIERMTGGSFNRIIGITIPSSTAGEDPVQLVLRVPRIEWMVRTDRDVAILRYVRQHTSIPLADVNAFDLTGDNPVKSPYILQNRILGTSLQDAHIEGLSTEEWCSVAREIGRIMLSLQGTSSTFPGLVESATNEAGEQVFTVVPFDIKGPHDMEWKKNAADYALTYPKNPDDRSDYEKSTFYLLVQTLGRWRARELRQDPAGILYWTWMHRLVDAASQMERLGFLGDNSNCLSHLDLASRNIMVQRLPNNSLSVTGILDWDSAVFAPRFVGCAPPWWMWQDEDSTVDSEHDETGASDVPDKPHNRLIKKAFDETVGEDFLHYSYQPPFVFARRLFHIAMEGNHGNQDIARIEAFLNDWADFYKTLMEVEEASSEGTKSEHGEVVDGGARDVAARDPDTVP